MKAMKIKAVTMTLALAMMVGAFTGCSRGKKEGAAASQSTSAGTTSPTTKWPERAVEVIVPFKAGGDTDFYARTYAKYLEKKLGQPITIVNVDGAGGTVGAQQIASAKNDGYKVLFYHTGNLYTNKLLGNTDLDQKSFDISCIGVIDDTNVLVTNKKSGFKDAKDFLEKVKAAPGKYSVSTTISGFSYYTVKKMEKGGSFSLNAVDAGGASVMVPALLGGQVDLAVNSYGVFKQYIDNGDFIPLMTSGKKRNPNLSNVPTTEELGLANSAAERAYFFAFPKGTNPAIIQKLSDAVKAIQSDSNYVNDIGKMYYVTPNYLPSAEATKYMDDMWKEMEKMAPELNKK